MDSSIFCHMKRNWCWKARPKSPSSKKEKSTKTAKTEKKLANVKKSKIEKPKPVVEVLKQKKPPVTKRILKNRQNPQKPRKPYYDEKDKVALGLMRKLRVDWSSEEDRFLLLCRAAGTYLCQNTSLNMVINILISYFFLD